MYRNGTPTPTNGTYHALTDEHGRPVGYVHTSGSGRYFSGYLSIPRIRAGDVLRLHDGEQRPITLSITESLLVSPQQRRRRLLLHFLGELCPWLRQWWPDRRRWYIRARRLPEADAA